LDEALPAELAARPQQLPSTARAARCATAELHTPIATRGCVSEETLFHPCSLSHSLNLNFSLLNWTRKYV